MGKIKSFFNSRSIKTTLAFYVVLCLIVALILSVLSSGLCQIGREQINAKYRDIYSQKFGEKGQILLSDGTLVDVPLTFYTQDISQMYSDGEKILNEILGFLNIGLIPVWFILSISAAGFIFYKKRLYIPLNILGSAADNIAQNNLDFTVIYNKKDEMGKLCDSFEKMRSALLESNLEMWRQIEERKRLNAAFSHDLRTPLTVLKGQSDMLLKYVPDDKMSEEKVISTVQTMKKHIVRLENYVSTMNELQRLEDIEIKRDYVSKTDLINQLTECGEIVCQDKAFVINADNLTEDKLNIDLPVLMQIYENLLSNATRYAKKQITVSLSLPNLTLTVSDDGKGFEEKDLAEATKPFYKSPDEKAECHLGMGLNICKVLCEKHGGYLKLSNGTTGANVTAALL